MSFRADVRTAIVTVAETYQTANPTLLRDVKAARPASFAEGPLAYVSVAEAVTFSAGVRRRTMRPQLVVVNSAPDNIEAALAMDTLADALLDAYSNNPHAAGNTSLLEPTGIEDVEDQVGTVSYPGFAITFAGLRQEGR